jgi:hypothetical protein
MAQDCTEWTVDWLLLPCCWSRMPPSWGVDGKKGPKPLLLPFNSLLGRMAFIC